MTPPDHRIPCAERIKLREMVASGFVTCNDCTAAGHAASLRSEQVVQAPDPRNPGDTIGTCPQCGSEDLTVHLPAIPEEEPTYDPHPAIKADISV